MLKFGLHANTRVPGETDFDVLYDEILEETLWAEKYGFNLVAVDEHHRSPDGYFPTPMLVLSGLATRTQRIMLLPSVSIIPLHNPVAIAEEGAMLDIISKGRFIFGCGQGSVLSEFLGYGVDIKKRGPKLSEAVKLILRLWQEDDPLTHEGRYFKVWNALVSPKPLQKPRPQVWIAATKPNSVRRVAKLGDAWLAPSMRPMQELEGVHATYMEAAKKAGKQPTVALMREGFVTDAKESGLKEWGDCVRHTYLYYYKRRVLREPWVKREEDLTYEKLVQDRFVVGTPDECKERIEGFIKRLPVTEQIILRIRQPGMSHKLALKTIKMFGEKVMPYFQDKD